VANGDESFTVDGPAITVEHEDAQVVTCRRADTSSCILSVCLLFKGAYRSWKVMESGLGAGKLWKINQMVAAF